MMTNNTQANPMRFDDRMFYTDQLKFFDPSTWIYPIHLIGAGGINSLVGPALAKMGIKEIHVWDDDLLEPRNGPNEIAYSYRMIGQPKTAAMASVIDYLMGDRTTVFQHQTRVTADTPLEGVVISGVDSMKSRKIIWQAIQKNFLYVPLYIDGRSAGKNMAILALSPADFDAVEQYKTWLFDDAKAMPLECGARNFPPVAIRIAAEITRIITQFHHDDPYQLYTRCRL